MFAACTWSIKCRRKEKLIAQFGGKLRDEVNVWHYLLNKNEDATVSPNSKFHELNKGLNQMLELQIFMGPRQRKYKIRYYYNNICIVWKLKLWYIYE
jgi:hypothetical protein